MDSLPVYWRGHTEAHLASYQQLQLGNNCAQNAIATALNLLFNLNINGNHLAKLIDQTPLVDLLRYRLWPNGPTTPLNQCHLLEDIARYQGLRLSARLERGSLQSLSAHISNPNSVSLITIGWLPRRAPVITRGNQSINFNANTGFGFHVMLAAAYDPTHINQAGTTCPWGFINSWLDGGEELFWMSTAHLKSSWGFFTPFGGTFPMVSVRLLT